MQRRWRTSIPRPWRGGTWKTRMERAREATPARQSTGDESSRPRAARQPSASLTQSIRSAAPSPPGAEIPPATLGGAALGSERCGYWEEHGWVRPLAIERKSVVEGKGGEGGGVHG